MGANGDLRPCFIRVSEPGFLLGNIRTIPQGPNLPNDQEFVNELRLIGQAVAYGESTVDKAAEDLQALIIRLSTK